MSFINSAILERAQENFFKAMRVGYAAEKLEEKSTTPQQSCEVCC